MNLFWRTALALSAFAGNSVLCRLALQRTDIDAASFTTVRLLAGAIFLWCLLRQRRVNAQGDTVSALALWAYAAAFSFAYLGLTAATGALILFGTVQVTMIGTALLRGDRLGLRQSVGASLAIVGLVALLMPGVAAPPWVNGGLMVVAGIAWGVYSLRGKGVADPLAATAGNFMRGVVPALALSAITFQQLSLDGTGVLYAVASGALASGAGYAIWYSVLPHLSASQAATVQLCVPVLAALAGIVLLDESLSTRLVLSAAVVLGGVALVTFPARQPIQRSPRR